MTTVEVSSSRTASVHGRRSMRTLVDCAAITAGAATQLATPNQRRRVRLRAVAQMLNITARVATLSSCVTEQFPAGIDHTK